MDPSSAPGKAERQVPLDAAAEPGSWPQSGYDAGRSRYNPHATVPRERPAAAWTREMRSAANVVVATPDRLTVYE